jgi:hypothetical protein
MLLAGAALLALPALWHLIHGSKGHDDPQPDDVINGAEIETDVVRRSSSPSIWNERLADVLKLGAQCVVGVVALHAIQKLSTTLNAPRASARSQADEASKYVSAHTSPNHGRVPILCLLVQAPRPVCSRRHSSARGGALS